MNALNLLYSLRQRSGNDGNSGYRPRQLPRKRGSFWAVALILLSVACSSVMAQEELPLHEALAKGLIDVKCNQYAQEEIRLFIAPKGQAGMQKIVIPYGTWIELDGYKGAGKLFLGAARSGATTKAVASADLIRHPKGWALSVRTYPSRYSALVPVFKVDYTNSRKMNDRITQAGLDPLAAEILSNKSPKKDDVLGIAAGILMIDRENLSLSEFQGFVDRFFTRRMSIEQAGTVKGNSREAPLFIWTPTPDHLKTGQHLFEKAKFTIGNNPVPTSTTTPSGEMSGTITLADAMAKDMVAASAGKGLAGFMNIRMMRTAKAPPGPMQVTMPLGTYVLFDDKGDGQPVKLYPVHEGTVNLFGSVAGGVQVPCFNGSYKRRIKTTKTLRVSAGFDEKVAALFAGRPQSDYLQMGVELALLDNADLTRDQIQYHIAQVGVPLTQNLGVTDEIVSAAKQRLEGKAVSAVSPAMTSSISVTADTSSNTSATKPTATRSRSSSSQLEFGITRSAGEKGVRVDPNTPNDPDGLIAKSPNGAAMWQKMVEHVPEYPESELVGTWIAVPETEARQYVLALRYHQMEAMSAASGNPLPDQMKQMLAQKAALDQKMTHHYTGSLIFSPTGDVAGSIKGPNKPALTSIRAKWKFDGIQTVNFVQTTGLISKMVFAQNGRIAFHDERSGLLLVLKKQ